MDLIEYLIRTEFDFVGVLFNESLFVEIVSSLLSLKKDLEHSRKYVKLVLLNPGYSSFLRRIEVENLRHLIIEELTEEDTVGNDGATIKGDANVKKEDESRKLGVLNTSFAGPSLPLA
jgi:hypothetical protein